MTVSTSTSFVSYAGNGSLTTFAYTFKIFQDSDLLVTLVNDASGVETTQVLTTNYTVTGAGTASGGNVTFTTAPATGTTVKIRRVLPVTQETDYVANDPFPAEAHEDALDKLTMLVQQEAANSDLAISFPEGDVGSGLNNVVPSAVERADKLLSFDTEGNVQTQSAADLLTGSVLGANYTKASHTGDGTIVAFSTTEAAGSKNNIQVYIDGVYQNKDTFSISGSTLTFTEAPPLNSAIEFIVGNAVTSLTTDPDVVTYNQGGTGAQDRTLTSRLQDFVSVKDFGAVGDGTTDDTAAIQAACNAGAGSTVYFPKGNYKITSTIDLTGLRVRLLGAGTAYGVNAGTKLIFSPTSGDMFNCDSNYYMTVRDLGVDGDTGATKTTTNRCFVINNITRMKFENVTITGFSDAIVQDTSGGTGFNLTIDQCNITDCYYAMYIQSACHLITVTNSFFSNNGFGVRIASSANVSFKSTCIQVQGMDLARGREEATSYCFRFDDCFSVGFDNCYFEVNAGDTVTVGTQYLGQVNNVNGFQFKNSYVVGATNMSTANALIRNTDTAGITIDCNTFYRFPSNLTYVSANSTGNYSRHLVGRRGNNIGQYGLIVDNSFSPVLFLNNQEATSGDFGVDATYGAGNVARSFYDGETIRLVGTMVVTNWSALEAGGASTDYIGVGLPVSIDGQAHGTNDQVAIGAGYWNGSGELLPVIEDARPNIIRIKKDDFTANLTSGDAPTYVSFDISFKPEVQPT